jgi:hypothetical protein
MAKAEMFSKSFGKNPWATAGPIIVHLSIAVPLAAALSIWVDEAHTMNTINGSLAYTLSRAINFEMQPPLYFLLLNVWAKLGSSAFLLRLFSILCTALMIGVISKISKRVFPEIHPGWLTMAVAVNPYSIWAATEIRLYALLLLLTSVLFLTFYEGFLSEDATARRKRKWFFIFCVLSLYTQYYIVFMLAAMFFGLIILKKWEPLKRLSGYYILTIACSLPLLVTAMRQTAQHTKFILIDNNLLNYLSVGTRFLRYPLRLDWMSATLYMLVYSIYLAAMLALMAKYREKLGDRHTMILIMTLVITLFFLISINIVNNELVSITHTTVLFIPSLLMFFSVMSILPDEKRNKVLIPAFLVIFLVNSLYMVREYQPMAKLGDFRRVAEYIKKKERPGQVILIFVADMALPFSYYYSGMNLIIPLPNKMSLTQYDLNDFVLKGEQDIAKAIEREGLEPRDVWMVNGTVCKYLGVNLHCEILEEYIKNNYTIEDDKSFYRSRVRLLRRKNAD